MDKKTKNFLNDSVIRSNEEDKEPNYQEISKVSSEIVEGKFSNDNNFRKQNLFDRGTQTENLTDHENFLMKNKFSILFIFLFFILIQYLAFYYFSTMPKKFWIDSELSKNDQNLFEDIFQDNESLNNKCESIQNSTISENLIETVQVLNELDERKFLSQEECFKFNNISNITEKINFLNKTLRWTPMHDGHILKILNLYSYKNCEFFIGNSVDKVYKFTIYNDYTKMLAFSSIDYILPSTNKEYLAISDNMRDVYQLNVSSFQRFAVYLDNNKRVIQYKFQVVYSPDSEYLYLTRENINQILVYKTLNLQSVITLEVSSKVSIMVPSQNLHHLIVKDVNNYIKIFTIKLSNYIHLIVDKEAKDRLQNHFSELNEFS